ncbi:MAG: hypothetical protein ACKVKN_08835 [Pseudomonadales bacterium]
MSQPTCPLRYCITDHTSRQAGTLISQVTSLDNLGTENHYQETIRVTQPNAYLWELTEAEPAGSTMKAEFHRAP